MTLGERNLNLKLDGLPVLYIPRYFEFFVRGLPFGHPSWFLRGPASFSNLGADLMVEFWSDSFSWLSVAVVHYLARLVADIVMILSCVCYNLNGQKLSSNTLSTQLPNVLSNFT